MVVLCCDVSCCISAFRTELAWSNIMNTCKYTKGFNAEPCISKKAPVTPYPIRMLRIQQVVYITGKSRSWVYSRVSKTSKSFDPTFPQPVKLSTTASLWVESELMDWLQSRIDISRQAVEGSNHAVK